MSPLIKNTPIQNAPHAPTELPCSDVLKKILVQLDPQDAYSAAKAHPAFARAAKDPDVWSTIAARSPDSLALLDSKKVADLRSNPVNRAIKLGAAGAAEGATLALLVVPGLFTGGRAFELRDRVAAKRKASRLTRETIAAQARHDKASLLPRLAALGVEQNDLPEATLPKQVAQMRKADEQRTQLHKALSEQLLRHDWARAIDIVEILGSDAPLSLTPKQLDAVARKAVVEHQLEVARWLVGRGAKVSAKTLAKVGKEPKLSAAAVNHLVALGPMPLYTVNATRLVFGHSRPDVSKADKVLNTDLMQEDFGAEFLANPQLWPQDIVRLITPSIEQAQAGENAGVSNIVAIALRETERLAAQVWAAGNDLKSARRDIAVYQEILRQTLDGLKERQIQAVHARANALPGANTDSASAVRGIQGEYLQPDAEALLLQTVKQAINLTDTRAATMATQKLYAPLREKIIEQAHLYAEQDRWSDMVWLTQRALPTAVRDSNGTTLAQKVQSRFNALVHDGQIGQAIAMKKMVGGLAAAAPIQTHLDTQLHRAIDAADWQQCRQWLDLGGDREAVLPGQPVPARGRIVAKMQEAIATGRVDTLEHLLALTPGPGHLAWLSVAKTAFKSTFLRRRTPGVSFTPNLVQKRVMLSFKNAIIAGSWAEAKSYVQAGVPLSPSAQHSLDEAFQAAKAQRNWSVMAKITGLRVLASKQ